MLSFGHPHLLSHALFVLHFALVRGSNLGQWSSRIQFPLVPVAAAVHPESGQIVAWSAYSTNNYGVNAQNVTQTAVYNYPGDGSVQEFPVYVGHDMFCPGLNSDANGNLVVTGGDTAPATSVFTSSQWQWSPAADMNIPRGYQASATLSNGNTFVIGGSWSGGYGNKDGEVWDGNSWTLKRGCQIKPMLTNDPAGIFRADSHAWLFAWKGNSVFQAGPSKSMNWYFPFQGTNGSYSPAGTRGSDNDAMAGPAVMYDAVAGNILSVGGSPAYENQASTKNANLITISAPGSMAKTTTLSPMSYARIFATSVVLPDGQVLVIGGQTTGIPFSDAGSSQTPELWNPSTRQFTQLATQPTPRNYHSVALLLADGRVFSGGGGLCGNCDTNHMDAEIFTPPYLYASDGKTLAARPTITKVSSTQLKVGSSFTAALDSASGTISWSLIRLGTSTHTVNTDQRRVPLQSVSKKGTTYTFTLPSDAGILIPGYWWLFAIRNGVPSVATTILVSAA